MSLWRFITEAVGSVRSGAWLTVPRILAYIRLLILADVLLLVVALLTTQGMSDPFGRPIGTDFSQVWAAGVSVLAGHPEQPFDPAQHYAAQQAIFGSKTPFYGWHYPPFFLVVAVSLALMPYLPALFVWQSVTLVAYLGLIRRIVPHRLALGAAITFPAVFVNVTHGHNGFLTASLLGGGLLVLKQRPVVAGLMFGLLAYKPHFGLALPVALVAGRHWVAITATAVTVLSMCVVTLGAFGMQTWDAFRTSLHFTQTVVLEAGATGWEKIQSVFAAARGLGVGVPAAYALQGVETAGVMLALAWVWWRPVDRRLQAAALMVAALLSTPYVLDYDMVVLGPALALVAAVLMERGAPPWSVSLLAACWVAPGLARIVAGLTGIPVGVSAMLAFLGLVLRLSALPPRRHDHGAISSTGIASAAPVRAPSA